MTGNPIRLGVTIGSICTFIASAFMFLFHKNLDPAVIAFLPAVVALVGHYLGFSFAVTRAAMKEISQDQPDTPPPPAPVAN